MGSPVSVVVPEIVMQHVEELADKRYYFGKAGLHDTFSAVHKDKIDAFRDFKRTERRLQYCHFKIPDSFKCM